MKKIGFLTLFLLTVSFFTAQAQNGNAVISEVRVFDLQNGTAEIEVRISGNQAEGASSGLAAISGDGVLGNVSTTIVPTRSMIVPGNTTVMVATFPYLATGGNGPDVVNLDLRVIVVTNGNSNGRPWTVSREISWNGFKPLTRFN